jgi:hypothetical protein
MLYMVWGVIIFLFSDTFRVEALNLKCERWCNCYASVLIEDDVLLFP